MREPVYFSKVEYREVIGCGNTSSILLLNIAQRELSYQVFRWRRQMPGMSGMQTEESYGQTWTEDIAVPIKKVRNGKTGFEERTIKDEPFESEIVFSYGIQLTDKQMKKLLPYCDALDFEPYRDKEMSVLDEGCIAYRDEIRLYFTAISDSYIPKIELPMNYYYDEAHIWPSEKLYRYLVRTYFEGNKEVKGWGPKYFELSMHF